MTKQNSTGDGADQWNTSSDPRFFDYYGKESTSQATLQRYESIYDLVHRIRSEHDGPPRLKVADVGCGAGTQCLIWARKGHEVYGIDVNEPLLELARERAAAEDCEIRLELGSATELPWGDASMDACLVPELLEHVEDWKACLREFVRVLRVGGILYLSTTNKLCPIQHEFRLPLYSWYPGPLKRRYERLAKTTRPELANFATYPAVNWFTYFQLEKELRALGMRARDRFDVMDLSSRSTAMRWAVRAVRAAPPLRRLAHVASSSTIVAAVRA